MTAVKIPNSEALPVTRLRRRKQKPATQAERDALRFEAIELKFECTNDEWAERWLPWVRLAAIHVGIGQDRQKEVMKNLVAIGQAPNFLEGLTRTKEHLQDLTKLMSTALTRSFLVLERLGYSPDNPPRESPVN